MQTQSIVEASATIVTITALRHGDVYKRLPDDHEYGMQLVMGIVQDVMHNGTDSAFTALEFDTYTKTIALKVHKGGKDLRIFTATPEEITTELDTIIKSANDAVTTARTTLTEAQRKVEALEHQRQRVTEGQVLTSPSTELGVLDGEVA